MHPFSSVSKECIRVATREKRRADTHHEVWPREIQVLEWTMLSNLAYGAFIWGGDHPPFSVLR
jgi:hypothetical protein